MDEKEGTDFESKKSPVGSLSPDVLFASWNSLLCSCQPFYILHLMQSFPLFVSCYHMMDYNSLLDLNNKWGCNSVRHSGCSPN